MPGDLEKIIIGLPREAYGSNYETHLLEQYKLYVQMADKISERRQTANTYFLTINTALVALLGIVWPATEKLVDVLWYVIAGLAGMILCYSWYRLLRSYKDLNSGKFRVVGVIEKYLPLRPYDAEWESLGRGKNSKLYLPFTHIEAKIPWVFFALYLGVIAISIYCRIC